jgi:hypothetical protein
LFAGWLACAARTDAQPLTATITYPSDGTVNADLSQPIQWTSVAGVQAYYLYVGTTVGANDLVNTGETLQTSYLAAGLPIGQTLYARLWTKAGDVWRYVDSTFTAAASASLTATVTYPANGAANVDLSLPIQWTSVANVQAYYLYVGTTVGAKDVVDSGETLQTWYSAGSAPSGVTLYIRLWTRVGGVWRYVDSTFTAAPSLAARLLYPADGAVNADMSQPMQWSAVTGVQAYYLYVGTTVGAKDLVNTGEILQTSFQTSGLPSGQTLYARMWTKAGDVWRYRDSTFTAAPSTPLTATVTYPANGAANADMTQPIQWSTVSGAQSYYLYVGTTTGAKDVVNSGETTQTSYLAGNVPSGQTLYIRMWTRAGGVWRYVDSTFSAAPSAPVTATLTFPANGQVNARLTQPVQWTSVANVQTYYLYIGTTPGAKDLVDSKETLQTSYAISQELPSGQTLYARLWTKYGGVWRYVDSTFTSAALTAQLTNPVDGASMIDQSQPATWTAVDAVQAYYLYVGTTSGAKDVIDSGETPLTTWPIIGLPVGQTLYARLWTKVDGIFRYRDTTFTADRYVPSFVYPTDGAVGVSTAQPFSWASPPNADTQHLLVGTTPGGNDLFDSGNIVATSAVVPTLPSTGVLYARVSSRVNGAWRHSDIAFTAGSLPSGSTIVSPADGEPAFDTAQPFIWSDSPLARAYRLMIGTTPGGSDLHDSGQIAITRRFVPNLPVGTLFGRLQTNIGGQWLTSDFTFTVVANTASTVIQIKNALWATDLVRNMAPPDNRPFSWTLLAATVGTELQALCSDYAETLLSALGQLNLQLSVRGLTSAFNPTRDVHSLVELLNPDTAQWMVLDPTFDLAATRASDGQWATAEDIAAATATESWTDVVYVPLGANGFLYATSYYLDYPLLLADVYHVGQTPVNGVGTSILPFMQAVSMPISGTQQPYAVRCVGVPTAELLIDGVVTTVDCTGVDGFSAVFLASAIATTGSTPASTAIYQPRRFVF